MSREEQDEKIANFLMVTDTDDGDAARTMVIVNPFTFVCITWIRIRFVLKFFVCLAAGSE